MIIDHESQKPIDGQISKTKLFDECVALAGKFEKALLGGLKANAFLTASIIEFKRATPVGEILEMINEFNEADSKGRKIQTGKKFEENPFVGIYQLAYSKAGFNINESSIKTRCSKLAKGTQWLDGTYSVEPQESWVKVIADDGYMEGLYKKSVKANQTERPGTGRKTEAIESKVGDAEASEAKPLLLEEGLHLIRYYDADDYEVIRGSAPLTEPEKTSLRELWVSEGFKSIREFLTSLVVEDMKEDLKNFRSSLEDLKKVAPKRSSRTAKAA